MVATRKVDAASVPERLRGLDGVWFGHDRLPFVSVPAEWSAAMLAQAALHTLDVNEELIENGFILKDATPANVLFDGTTPVFVDVPSIEPLIPGRDLWLARHQFETTFLLPLMANLDAGLPIAWALGNPTSGLAHEQLARILGPRRWWGLGRIRNVALPAALSSSSVGPASGATSGSAHGNVERTKYVLSRSMTALRGAVRKLSDRIDIRHSHWSDYESTRGHYSDQDLVKEREFVGRVLETARAGWVLDVGANTGEFSEMAAVIQMLWRST